MTSEDSTPPPLPSAAGPRKRFLGGRRSAGDQTPPADTQGAAAGEASAAAPGGAPDGDAPRSAGRKNPPGVRTAGEIAADSERADAGTGSATDTDGGAATSGVAATGTASAGAGSAASATTKTEQKNASRAERKAAKSRDKGAEKGSSKEPKGSKEKKPVTSATLRSRAAVIIWTLAVVCALILAVGALLVALRANQDNAAVGFVLQAADTLDLGIFSRENGIFEFDGADGDVRNALVNWGLGAVAYLVVGKVLDRLVGP
ncbi:MAG: hypothetical protein Q8Q02_15465 [Nocardioides sp.]|nr:hypothetical protein [Nocardioides sp.]